MQKLSIINSKTLDCKKQFALNQTTNNWVLSLDADEVLSDKLIEEIQTLDFSKANGFMIPRTHVFLNKVFQFGAESKRPILRLFDKLQGKFTEAKVHEVIEVNGAISALKNEMLHYTVLIFQQRLTSKSNTQY